MTGAQRPGAPDLDNASVFLAAAGPRLTHVAADPTEGLIDLGPAHHTPWGVVDGGVYTTVTESAASVGATAVVADRGQIAVGAIPARAAESSHEEQYGYKTSSHDDETDSTGRWNRPRGNSDGKVMDNGFR